MADQDSYTCPNCGMTSYNPNDVKNQYCGYCHMTRLQAEFSKLPFSPKIILVGGDEGELPKGSRAQKINSEPGDTFPDGAKCTVVGAMGPMPDSQRADMILKMAKRGIKEDILFIYWVIWDDLPGVPVAITDYRLEGIES